MPIRHSSFVLRHSSFHRAIPLLAVLALAAFLTASPAVRHLNAQYEPLPVDTGVVGLGLALRRLGTTASLLYIVAHPDDEDNGLLARFSRGEGKRVATLTLTRGEGGQNEIGPELFDALGVLRTEELLAVHRLDGVEQFFGRVVDFGYSFSVEETVAQWGREETIGDIVRVIRTFRPDVVITLFHRGAGGGQHHQASARLAQTAFIAAADRDRFPEQLGQGLEPWQAKKLYRALWNPGPEEKKRSLAVEIGAFDMLLGMSYAEFGALARNFHRCQGMNAAPEPGAQKRWYSLQAEFRSDTGDTIFAGVPTTLADALTILPKSVTDADDGQRLVRLAEASQAAFDEARYADVARLVMEGLREVRWLLGRAKDCPGMDSRQCRFILEEEEKDWLGAAAKAHQLYHDATIVSTDGLVVPGEEFQVTARLANRGPVPVGILDARLEAPPGWRVSVLEGGERELVHNAVGEARFSVVVATDAAPTQPFFSRQRVDAARYRNHVAPELSIRPFAAPLLRVVWTYESSGHQASVSSPVVFRWYDPEVARRRSYAVKVVPSLSVRVMPEQSVVPLRGEERPRPLQVHLHSNVPDAIVNVRLSLPDGWKSTPESFDVALNKENEAATVEFQVELPPSRATGSYEVRAVATLGRGTYVSGYQSISYHHIETRHLYTPARSTFRVMDVELPPTWNVGYVMGVGDQVPVAIEQLGAKLSFLDAADLAAGDLSVYDVIVTGVRAYKDRQDLIASNHRLLEYVRQGGVMLVQYNKYELNRAQYAPYAHKIAQPHDRVTDENAAVTVLRPEHPLFLAPNRIVPRDWSGWVQERGLYFLAEWDERFVPLLEIEDSFEYNKGPKRGSLLIAAHGKGYYVYTGLSFFRQLPAGVPGAYRLFANLLSLKKTMSSGSSKER